MRAHALAALRVRVAPLDTVVTASGRVHIATYQSPVAKHVTSSLVMRVRLSGTE